MKSVTDVIQLKYLAYLPYFMHLLVTFWEYIKKAFLILMEKIIKSLNWKNKKKLQIASKQIEYVELFPVFIWVVNRQKDSVKNGQKKKILLFSK